MQLTTRRKWVGPREILQALRALRAVATDANRTDAIGEFIGSLTGPSATRLYHEVCNDPVGRRLLQDRQDLKTTLDNREYLASLPAGSLGRSYYEWTASRDFNAQGLADAISGQVSRDLADPHSVMSARIVDMHDLWHVLNGWDEDIHGELHLLGYSYAQLGARAWLILGKLTVLILRSSGHREGKAYLRNAIRLGRQAPLLAAVEWETLLPLQLTEVRQRLGVPEPEPYARLAFAEVERIRDQSTILRALRRMLPA